MKMLDDAHDELMIAVGLIGTGNPAAHKVQCAASDLTSPWVDAQAYNWSALFQVDEAAAMLGDDHAALPHLSSAAQFILAALGERAQEQGRAAPAPSKKRPSTRLPPKRRKIAAPVAKKTGRKKRAAP